MDVKTCKVILEPITLLVTYLHYIKCFWTNTAEDLVAARNSGSASKYVISPVPEVGWTGHDSYCSLYIASLPTCNICPLYVAKSLRYF